MQKIGFIGVGPVGTAFGVRLSQKGYKVVAVYNPTLAKAQRFARAVPNCHICETAQGVADIADFVFITTPDDVIPKVAGQVNWHAGQTVIHCSGACSTDVLEPAREKGAKVGSLHPCQTFASVDQAVENLPGSTFAIEAEEPLLTQLKEMVTALHGSWLELKAEDKVLYHASASIACNYFYTIVKVAADLWQNLDKSTAEATQAFVPILRGSINNLSNVGLPGCLTGPIARGDLDTIHKHLDALEKRAPSVVGLYKALGIETIPIALAKGTIDHNVAQKLRDLLKPD